MTEATEQAAPKLAHLHIHSEYSLMDGAIRISDAVRRAKEFGHTAIAVTDHGNMFGAIEFYTVAKGAGIKAILGSEIYHAGGEETLALLKKETSDDTQVVSASEPPPAFHLVLLAKNVDGYKSLIKVVSYGFLDEGGGSVPLIQEARLNEFSSELIALSGCLKGEFGFLVSQLLDVAADDFRAALESPSEAAAPIVTALRAHVERMRARYGEGYYIELINNNLSAQKRILPHLAETARFFNLPLVATCDAHYLRPEDAEAHVVLTGIKNDLTMSKMRNRLKSANFHLFTDAEMEATYGAWPEALANTLKIADQCNVKFEFDKYFLPRFELDGGETESDALRRMGKEGLEERLKGLRVLYGAELDEEKEKKYWDRLEYETEVIINMGFPGYFLIVQDFINWAKDHNIPVGPGRGSGAGSLVAYALRITDLDPLKLNLIFERFLNPERVSMPDFDVDFCQWRRDEVIRYVTGKYGSNNVAQITTFGKMKAKAALRDVGRVLEISYGKVDRIAKLIPNEIDIKLKDALEREPRIMEEAERDPTIKDMITIALQIEGLSRHTSVHAAGVVISEGGMENYVPVYRAEGASLITQYEMKNAEKVGLVKFDFLGLKTLTVIAKAVELIHKQIDPHFDITTIDIEKREVYNILSAGQTVGVFQLEGSGFTALALKLKPSRFEDIVAMVALYRPGPLGSGMVDDFIERKHGRQKITYQLPTLEPILQETYGIILYQEQVQKIAATLASYSLGEADLLRRAMGKKKPEEMAKQKTRFIEGAVGNSINQQIADELFELMAKFAEYGFNKSHSAAYGLVTYQTAYLKTYFPEQFMAAILTCDLDNSEKIVRYVEDCRRMKFKILPPDISRSELEFDVPEKGAIGFGLAAIKGIGAGSLEEIVQARREGGPFLSLTDLARRVNLHKAGKKTLELLVEAGALDSFKMERGLLMAMIPDMVKFSEDYHSARKAGQRSLFDDDTEETTDDVLEPKNIAKLDLPQDQWLLRERALLGVFLSGHPLDHFPNDVAKFSKFQIKDIPAQVGSKKHPIVALLADVSERTTKTGRKVAYVMLEDQTGSYEGIMFEADKPESFPPKGTLVVAYCTIMKNFDGTGVSFRVEAVKALQDVRRELIRRAVVRLPAELGAGPEQLKQQKEMVQSLRELMLKHPGRTYLEINLKYKQAMVRIDSQLGGVDLSDSFFQNLKGLYSHGADLTY